MFIEEGEVAYTYINGKKVPVVKCETEVVLRNKETGYEYGSDKEAEDDILSSDDHIYSPRQIPKYCNMSSRRQKRNSSA